MKGDSTGKIYSAKELVTLTADNISKLAVDKVITFTAQWLPKNEAASYNVRHFIETAEGKYELKEEKTLIGKPGATAFAIPKNYEGYEVDYSVEGTAVSYTHLDVYKRQGKAGLTVRRALTANTALSAFLHLRKSAVWRDSSVFLSKRRCV